MSEQKEINKPTRKLIRAYLTPESFRILENVNGKSDGDLIREAYSKDNSNIEQLDWFVIKSLVEHAVSEKIQAIKSNLLTDIGQILKETYLPVTDFFKTQIIRVIEQNFDVQRKRKTIEHLEGETNIDKIQDKELRNQKLRSLVLGEHE